jgi:PPOX class probable F420-dependent enzyme
MAVIPDSARAVVESGRPAHLVTINSDGSPQVTCVWVGVDGDALVAARLRAGQQKLRNLRRDPRIALSIDTDRVNDMGLTEYLVVYGRAQVTEGRAPELLQRLAEVYIGTGVKFPPMANPPSGYVLRITPERFAGVVPWTAPAR